MNFWMKCFNSTTKISGNSVNLETSIQLNPNFLISLNVPPELIIFMSYFLSTDKRFCKFLLSDTDIKAVLFCSLNLR